MREFRMIVLGLVVGAVIFGVAATSQKRFRPEDAGLGQNTFSGIAYDGRLRVSAQRVGQVAETIASFTKSKRPVVLWLGASQLHAINNLKDGDELAVSYAVKSAEKRGANLNYLQMS